MKITENPPKPLVEQLRQVVARRRQKVARELEATLKALADGDKSVNVDKLADLAAAAGMSHDTLVEAVELYQKLRQLEAEEQQHRAKAAECDAEWQKLQGEAEEAQAAFEQAKQRFDAVVSRRQSLAVQSLDWKRTAARVSTEATMLRKKLGLLLEPVAAEDHRADEPRAWLSANMPASTQPGVVEGYDGPIN